MAGDRMKIALAYAPESGGEIAAHALWRLADRFERVETTAPLPDLRFAALTGRMDLRSILPLHHLASEPCFAGNFLIWRMMQFLGPVVSRQYRWLTVLRDPVDWTIALFNLAHRLRRDPKAPQFGYPAADRFSDWIVGVEPNVQAAFAPEPAGAVAFAQSANITLTPLERVDACMKPLYRLNGAPPLPIPQLDDCAAPRLCREDLSQQELRLIEARFIEDIRVYEYACAHFQEDVSALAADELAVHTPQTIAEFAALAGQGPVYIYGHTQFSRIILRTILDTPGVDFAGFLDSYWSGMVGRHPVRHIDSVPPPDLRKAVIIIGAASYGQIIRRLIAAGASRIWDGYPCINTLIYNAFGQRIGPKTQTVSYRAV